MSLRYCCFFVRAFSLQWPNSPKTPTKKWPIAHQIKAFKTRVLDKVSQRVIRRCAYFSAFNLWLQACKKSGKNDRSLSPTYLTNSKAAIRKSEISTSRWCKAHDLILEDRLWQGKRSFFGWWQSRVNVRIWPTQKTAYVNAFGFWLCEPIKRVGDPEIKRLKKLFTVGSNAHPTREKSWAIQHLEANGIPRVRLIEPNFLKSKIKTASIHILKHFSELYRALASPLLTVTIGRKFPHDQRSNCHRKSFLTLFLSNFAGYFCRFSRSSSDRGAHLLNHVSSAWCKTGILCWRHHI